VRFALFCGLIGPALGVALVAIGLLSIRLVAFGQPPMNWEPGNLVWFLLLYPLAVVYAGPGGAIFGAVATWLLIRQQEAGKTPRALRIISIAFGLAFGGLVMPIYFVLVSPILHGFSGLWLRGTLDWFFGVLLGSFVGGILGLVIATRLSRSRRLRTPVSSVGST